MGARYMTLTHNISNIAKYSDVKFKLSMLFRMGARYMTLTHSCNTPWAEAAQMEHGGQGLSDFGEKVGHDYLH